MLLPRWAQLDCGDYSLEKILGEIYFPVSFVLQVEIPNGIYNGQLLIEAVNKGIIPKTPHQA